MKLRTGNANAGIVGLFVLGGDDGDHGMNEVRGERIISGRHYERQKWVKSERSVAARAFEGPPKIREMGQDAGDDPQMGRPEPSHQIYLALLMSTTQQLRRKLLENHELDKIMG